MESYISHSEEGKVYLSLPWTFFVNRGPACATSTYDSWGDGLACFLECVYMYTYRI